MSDASQSLDTLCVNTLRLLAVDAVQHANSGHPGLPLGAAPMAYVLWQHHLRHNPKDPHWPDRDRFVLSAGHGSMLLYALLHTTGYDLSLDDLKAFRQWESRTPGHPERFMTPGVEATTGPLGQGSANAVGMALAEVMLAQYFNKGSHVIVGHFTYALVSDGDLMEGVAAEAASLAGHLGLGKLVYLYDANEISLDGPTDLTFSEDVGKRYAAMGWHVQHVDKGDTDYAGLDAAIKAAKEQTRKPSLIVVRTTIGFGSPNKQGTSSCHGSPLGAAEVKLTKETLGWDGDKHFEIPAQASEHLRQACTRGAEAQAAWQKRFDAYDREFPVLAQNWRDAHAGKLPDDLASHLPKFEVGSQLATREASSKVLNAIADRVPYLVGGDADLSCSTLTSIKSSADFNGQGGQGRNIRYGVREHAMGSVANGIAYHGGLHPFTGTFFVFSDYMRPALRLAALNKLPVTHVWTHDSVGLGEDGPTHQPIEHLAALRAMPNFTVIRPADAVETAQAWHVAMQHRTGPVGLVLSRQKLPTLDYAKLGHAADVARGAYVLSDARGGKPQGIIIATGSEVHIALAAQALLAKDNVQVRVVSMPSWELFASQPESYRQQVLPSDMTARLAIEAGVTFGWERWVGSKGQILGIDHFGASAPGPVIYDKFGLTPEHAAELLRKSLG